jgi:hypothetical protein
MRWLELKFGTGSDRSASDEILKEARDLSIEIFGAEDERTFHLDRCLAVRLKHFKTWPLLSD